MHEKREDKTIDKSKMEVIDENEDEVQVLANVFQAKAQKEMVDGVIKQQP